MVSTIFAGSFSLPLSLPASMASRTAFSISRCEVMPTFLRKLRRLVLKTSSFMGASRSRPCRIVQHLLGEIALGAVGAGIGIAALHVAVLAANDVVVRARRDIVGAAECVVVGAGVDHGRLAAFEATGEQWGCQQQRDEVLCGSKFHWRPSIYLVSAGRLSPTWSGMIPQSIEKMAACFEADGCPGQARGGPVQCFQTGRMTLILLCSRH